MTCKCGNIIGISRRAWVFPTLSPFVIHYLKLNRKIIPLILLLIGGCFSSSVEEKEAKKLAEELFEHTDISEIDDCTRFQKYINGIPILIEKDTVRGDTSSYLSKPKYYKEVLAEEGISERDFEYFKRRLNETGLRHYYKKGNFSVFVTGGMLGDIEGILVVHRNDTIPQNGFRFNEHYYISIGNEIERDVYRIRG